MGSKKRTVGILIMSILCLLIGLIFARFYYIKVENDKLELMFSYDCLKDNMGRVEPNEKYYEIMNSILGEDRQIGTLEDNICHYVAEKDDYAYDKETGTGYIDNEILIYAKDGISRDNVENLAQGYNAEIVGQIKTINYYQWKFNTSYSLLELKEICNNLEQETIVEHATINYTYKINSQGINYGEQWKQENWSETNISGSNWGLEAIKAISAWKYMEQMNPVRIGLIDSGFDANTGVENDKEFQNLIEQEKIQGTGHEDLEFSATCFNVPPTFLNAASHGTHVAGIMAATSDNSEGICGTYPYGKNNLYGVNCIGSAVKEETTLGQYQVCFAFLIEKNVKVINSSIISKDCGNWFLQSEIYKDRDSKNEIKKISVEIATLLKKYIDYDYDFVIVQAAGNDSNCQYTRLKCGEDGNILYNKKGNCKYDEHGLIIEINSSNFKIKNGFWKRKFYYIDSNGVEHEIINMNTNKIIQSEFLESKYSSSISAIDKEEFKDVYDRIIVVGAVGLSKNESTNATFYHIWEHSNLGERIDVVAPGDNIYSTIIGGYDYYSGTSMAAPYVSGTAAMVWSANNDLTGVQVKEIICKTANQRITSVNANSEFSKLPDNVVWYKMINAKLAVEEAIRCTDTIVVPIEDETQSTEPVEITEVPTEQALQISAVDLIDKTIPEIITLMNGEYQIIKTENDGYIYIQNQSVLSGMEFYISVSGDDIVSANNGEEIHSDTLKTNLESGKYPLDGIQVNKSGKVSDSIQADMNYKSCSKVLGDFDCNGGTGGYLGGSIETALYTYNEKNAKVILHFNMPSEIINDLRLGKIISVSAEEMKSYNPKLENVVVKKNETVTDVQTEQTESISVIPKGANTYNGHSYVVYPESMTWQEAKEYCEKLGGHLVTISDADEQKFVEDLAEKFTDKTSYWLGGYYSDSEWKWVDNTEFSYTNWDSWTDGTKEYRQPDNFYGDEYYLRFANKDFTYTDWKSNKGKWNDVSNEADGTSGDVPLNFFGLICEWDIISQNNNTETEATVSVDNVTYLEEISITESDRYTGNEGDSFVYPIGKHKNTRGNTCIDGESYEHGIECWLARWNYEYESSWAYGVFHLDKKYSILRGECHIIQSYNTTDFDVTLEFLGDNALLNSYHLTPDSMPIEIDVNISNCADLKIYIYDNEKQKGGTSFGLVDMKLQK